MRTRVISAVIGLILLAAVVWCGQIVLGAAVLLLAIIGLHEYYSAVSAGGYKPIRIIGYLSCLPILFIGFNGAYKTVATYVDLFKSINAFSMIVFAVIVSLMVVMIVKHDKYNLNDISLTAFGILYIPFLFSFVVLTRNLDSQPSLGVGDGFFFMWLIFIGAWGTDTFAYFVGITRGRTKILPAISPKKSLEGSIGGVVGCVALSTGYGYYLLHSGFVTYIPIFHFALLGLLNGIISQVGDWAASAIKRYVGIKDYGKVMPGHGGVLDRFDSILFIAPVVYYYISFIILQ